MIQTKRNCGNRDVRAVSVSMVKSEPSAARFASDSEMQTAFDAALAFESDHDPAASVANSAGPT